MAWKGWAKCPANRRVNLTVHAPLQEVARACSHSREPCAYTGNHDHGGEMTIELFVSGGDATELFEPPEQPLSEIARLVPALTVAPRRAAISPCRDDRLGAKRHQGSLSNNSREALLGFRGSVMEQTVSTFGLSSFW